MRDTISKIHVGLAWVVVAAVVVQFFLAGLGIFGASSLQAHRMNGNLIAAASLLLLAVALVGRLGRGRIGLAALLVGLTIIQTLLTKGPSLVAALHPLNAVAILFVARALALRGMEESIRIRRIATAGEQRISGGRVA